MTGQQSRIVLASPGELHSNRNDGRSAHYSLPSTSLSPYGVEWNRLDDIPSEHESPSPPPSALRPWQASPPPQWLCSASSADPTPRSPLPDSQRAHSHLHNADEGCRTLPSHGRASRLFDCRADEALWEATRRLCLAQQASSAATL